MAKSLAAQTPGALSNALELPAVFQAPMEQVKARFIAPYVTFAHPKRADEWSKITSKFRDVAEGEMFLMRQDAIDKLDPLKCCWLCHKQFWAEVNAAGEVLRASFVEQPKPFKEHIEAVVIAFVGDALVSANVQFRSTKCPAAKQMADALQQAATPAWADKSPEHKETLVIQQPFMRFYGEIGLGPNRTSRTTGLPYKTTTCKVKPTGIPEWRLLKAFSEDANTKKALDNAAQRFEYRISEIANKAK